MNDDVEDRRSQQPNDESRKLFQRLWTDEDEIELLQGFLEYTNQKGQHNSYDTNLFYDQIKSKLQLGFNKNQLVEKLRRLKKKYRNVVSRINSGKDVAFKSSHDHATFDISCKIWSFNANVATALDDEETSINVNVSPNANFRSDSMGDERSGGNSKKRLRMKVEENRDLDKSVDNVTVPSLWRGDTIPSVIEETVRSCLPPMIKEIMDTAVNGFCGGIGMTSPLPLSFVMSGGNVDESWRKQQILELEVYSRRLELVQDEIRLQLHELRSSRS